MHVVKTFLDSGMEARDTRKAEHYLLWLEYNLQQGIDYIDQDPQWLGMLKAFSLLKQ